MSTEICSVNGCRNRKLKVEQEVIFFRFPKDKNRKQIWIQFCNRLAKFNAGKGRICQEHFSSKQFRDISSRGKAKGKVRLKIDAVPDLLVDSPSSSETSLPQKGQEFDQILPPLPENVIENEAISYPQHLCSSVSSETKRPISFIHVHQLKSTVSSEISFNQFQDQQILSSSHTEHQQFSIVREKLESGEPLLQERELEIEKLKSALKEANSRLDKLSLDIYCLKLKQEELLIENKYLGKELISKERKLNSVSRKLETKCRKLNACIQQRQKVRQRQPLSEAQLKILRAQQKDRLSKQTQKNYLQKCNSLKRKLSKIVKQLEAFKEPDDEEFHEQLKNLLLCFNF